MSYGFSLGFKQANSLGDAMVYAHNVVTKLGEGQTAKKYIEENKYFAPSNKVIIDDDLAQNGKVKYIRRLANDKWLNALFDVHFVYFHEAKLLAILGDEYPDHICEMFDGFVYFQNSCDQDYQRKEWSNIEYFNNIYDEVMNTPLEKIIEEECYYAKGEDDYSRRSVAYDRIYKTLKLNEWMWGHDDDAFTRFTLSAIETTEQKFELELFASVFFEVR